jgi:carbonic anhydrase/acetyltransferase-like protein (isoleucine patch superfamily)
MLIEFQGKTPKVAPSAFVAPTAVLIGDVEVGEESSIWFGAVVRGDHGPIRIGARTNVQDNAVIHVSRPEGTIIGDDVTIGHGAIMEDCLIGAGALVGTGAIILNGATIGESTLIAAGSVVSADATIESRVVAAGAPARVKKPLEGASVNWVVDASRHYVDHSREYLREGVGDPDIQEMIESKAGIRA